MSSSEDGDGQDVGGGGGGFGDGHGGGGGGFDGGICDAEETGGDYHSLSDRRQK